MAKCLSFFCLVTLLWAGSYSYGQEPDSSRVDSLLKQMVNLVYVEPDSAELLGEEIEAMYGEGQRDERLLKAYQIMGALYLSQEAFEDAKKYFDRVIQVGEEFEKPGTVAAGWTGLGSVFRNQGQYTEAVVNYRKAIQFFQQNGDSSRLSSVYNNLGNLFFELADFPRSLRMHLRALRIRDRVGEAEDRFQSMLNIGEIYKEMGDVQGALDYFKGADEWLEGVEDKPSWKVDLYVSRAECLSTLGDFSSAEANFREALKLGTGSQHEPSLIKTYLGKGEMFLKREELDSARFYFQLAREFLTDQSNVRYNALSLDGLSRTEFLAGNHKEALLLGKKAVEAASESGHPGLVARTSKTLAENAAQNGDYRSAYLGLKRREQYLDSLRSGERQRELGRLEVEFEKRQQDVELAYLKEKQAHSEDIIERQNVWIGAISVALTLLVVIGLLLFVGNLRSRRFSKEMAKLNQEIRTQAVEIRKSRDELEVRVEERTRELRESNQRLRDREMQLSMILHSTEESIGLVELREDGEIVIHTINDGFIGHLRAHDLGTPREEIEGKTLRAFLSEVMLYSEAELELWHENFQNVFKKGESTQFEYLAQYPNGDSAIFDTKLSPIPEDSGVIRYGLYVAQDVTEKKKAEEHLISTILETEDRERKRIAKELHDSLGQLLTASSLNLDAIREQIKSLDPAAQKKYHNALEFLTQAIRESRGISHNLMPKAIEDFGLIAAVESMLEGLQTGTKTQFKFYQNFEGRRLPYTLELALYRITQEAVNNVLKHAEAGEVILQLMLYPDMVILTIDDDGLGFDPKKMDPAASFGITGIKNRVSSFGGIFSLDSREGRGTLLTIEIPLNMA